MIEAPMLSRPRFVVLIALAVVALLNSAFLILSLLQASAPTNSARRATLHAFETGDLGHRDFLEHDWVRGNNQYNDCMVLQLIINRRGSLIEKTLAPQAYVSDDSYSDVCASLHGIVSGAADTSKMYSDEYARYWHGYLPVNNALLSFSSVAQTRIILRSWVIAALLTLIVNGWRAGGPFRVFGASVGLISLVFWSLPFYGQGLSFAPSDGVVIFGIALMIAHRQTLVSTPKLIVFCAGFGCLVAFLDFLTGPIPVAACLTFVAAYFIARGVPHDGGSRFDPLLIGMVAVLAFGTGAALTIAIKQALALFFLGPDVFHSFWDHLRLYSGHGSEARGLLSTYGSSFMRLLHARDELTFGNRGVATLLLLASAVAWILSAYVAIASKGKDRLPDFLAYLIGGSGIVGWILLMPTHTAIHAGFMVRILIVPISLGWASLVWAGHGRWNRPAFSMAP